MGKLKPLGKCSLCNKDIPGDAHGVAPFCSQVCKISNREIEQLLELAETKQALVDEQIQRSTLPACNKIFCIGDTHFPFTKLEVLDEIYKAIEREQPDCVIQMGDLYDFFSQTRFPHLLTVAPADELKTGRRLATNMWTIIGQLVPRASKYQILGNHDDRPAKRMVERCPELAPFFNIDTQFEFPSVTTFFDSKQEIIIGDICFMHGFRKSGDHMRHNLMKTVVGHLHLGAVHFLNLRHKILWELNCGYVANPQAAALSYTQQRWTNWSWGYGLIENGVPKFVPIEGV